LELSGPIGERLTARAPEAVRQVGRRAHRDVEFGDAVVERGQRRVDGGRVDLLQ
jgi:hypothetical protein